MDFMTYCMFGTLNRLAWQIRKLQDHCLTYQCTMLICLMHWIYLQ